MRNNAGQTLIELAFTLTVFGILCSLGFPRVRRAVDTVQVRAAREQAFALAVRARSIAIAHGGADLVFTFSDKSIAAVERDGTVAEQLFVEPRDILLSADGTNAPQIVLRYDALGIGRMASRTIRVRKGAAEAGLTFSSFGRVRRW